MINGIVNKIIPFSSVDGPGNRTVVFLQGCGFRCSYCHNPETMAFCDHCGRCVSHCPVGALAIEEQRLRRCPQLCINCDRCLLVCPSNSSPKAVTMSVEDIFERIAQTRAFISGITISGGECTLQYDFLTEILKRAQRENIPAFIDTNGDLPVNRMETLIPYFHKAMLDIKSVDDTEHSQLTGKPAGNVLANADLLLKKGKIFELRSVIIPEKLDNRRNVAHISQMLAPFGDAVIYKLIKFRPIGVKDADLTQEPSDQFMEQLANLAHANGCRNIRIL